MNEQPTKELLAIIDNSRLLTGGIDEDFLKQGLILWLVKHDLKLWDHAYKLGKAAGGKAKKTYAEA